MEEFQLLDYLILLEEPLGLTARRYLFLFFSPYTLDPFPGPQQVIKVLRWAVVLSQFQYRNENFDGRDNVMEYTVTRWVRGYRGKRTRVQHVTYFLL